MTLAKEIHCQIDVVYEDTDFIAVNKPPGILCVPGLSTPVNLFDAVKALYPNARVVHRLDMATSGLVLFALHHQSQKLLGQLFEKRRIKKSYSAVITGILEEDSGEVHAPIICDWPNRPKQKIDWLQGKKASTLFQVKKRFPKENCTHVQLEPHTGRTHQLRIHMLHIGHSIIGDVFYNNGAQIRNQDRLMLHAESLNFIHPTQNKAIILHCEAPF